MKNSIILLLLLFSKSAFINSQIHQKFVSARTVIAGSIVSEVNNAPDILTVLFCDPTIESNKIRNVFRISENKYFHTSANIFFTQNTTIKYGKSYYNFLVSPGDSIYIKIDPSQSDICKRVVFSGDNAELNNQFVPFVQYLYGLNAPKIIDINGRKKEVVASFKNYMRIMEDSIDNYAKTYKLIPDIAKWAKRDVIYTIANQIFDYTGKQSELASDTIFEIFNSDNFKSMYFPYHLIGYTTALLRNDTCYTKTNSNDFKTKINILVKTINKMPRSISRDYILFSYLEKFISSSNTIIFDINDNIFKLFSNDYFVTRIKEEMAKVSKIDIHPFSPIEGISYLNDNGKIESLSNTDIFDVLKKRAKDKVIYIEIYATWCGPCKAEIPAARTLRNVYKDKDVEFVYLCLGSKLEDWQSIITKDFNGGENYFFDTSATDMFTGLYTNFFKGYPTFVIIDRKGNLLTKGIPRPSNINEVISVIDSLK